MRVGVLLVGLALLVGIVSRADASEEASAFQATFKVVGATHTSSARKSTPPEYSGSSTSSWTLAPATSKAPNRIELTSNAIITAGLGQVNVRGVYRVEATTNRRGGHCVIVAPTGTKKYGLTAPGPFQLGISSDPKNKNGVLVTQGLGFNVHASLGNAYLKSECSTSLTGQPGLNELMIKSMPRSAFAKKTVVIRYGGSTNEDGIAYRWSTTFTLERIKFQS